MNVDLLGSGAPQRERDGVVLVSVEHVEPADGEQLGIVVRVVVHAELILRVAEPRLPLVHVQHRDVY